MLDLRKLQPVTLQDRKELHLRLTSVWQSLERDKAI